MVPFGLGRTEKWVFLLAAALIVGAGLARGAGVSELIAPGAKVELISGGFKFTEGAAVDKDGNIYFSDIPNARIHKWTAADGKISIVREQTGQSNGLYIDAKGNVLACEGGIGKVTRMDKSGKVTPIAETYNGKPFNSPNDLWVNPKNGAIYFTDPRYGDESHLPQDSQQVYYVAPGDKPAVRVTTDLKKPNGIVGTRDGKRLYVADHGASKIFLYDIAKDGTLKNKKEFAPQGSDGMKLDKQGNLYLTDTGVTVYAPDGKKLGAIKTPEIPANLCFAGKDRKTLFITAQTGVYALKMAVVGAN